MPRSASPRSYARAHAPAERPDAGPSLAGERFEVRVGPVAHGGFCVARHEGRAVFVRHALPGEHVVVEVTEGHEKDRYLRADAVEILEASADRVPAPCPYAGPGKCGGCDWQHATPEAQRALKAAVIQEQLQRLAGIERHVVSSPRPATRTDSAGAPGCSSRWTTRAGPACARAARTTWCRSNGA